jgi:hypothetical protein
MRKILFSFALFLAGITPSHANTCHGINDTETLFNGFGASWDVFEENFTPLLQADCSGSNVDFTFGSGSENEALWHTAYYTSDGQSWQAIEIDGDDWSDTWIRGSGSASVSLTDEELNQINFVATYRCLYKDAEWKCGCSDAESCSVTGEWNIQTFSTEYDEDAEGGEEEEATPINAPQCSSEMREGTTGTWYEKTAEAGGACGYFETQEDMGDYYVAINGELWNNSYHCGACVEVTGANGTAVAKVTDLCPADDANPLCRNNHLDLSPATFEATIGDTSIGYSDITWKFVPCDTNNEPFYFYFQPESHTTWTSLHVRNAPHHIESIAFENTDGNFIEMNRTDYGFFIGEDMGAGPYTLRVTDEYNQVETRTGVELNPGRYSYGTEENQFLSCEE